MEKTGKTSDELKRHILMHLIAGSFTEPQLAKLCDVTERNIRKAIGELVAQGAPIVNLGHGFFVSDDPKVIEVAAKRLESHGVSILVRAANLRKIHPVKYLKQLAIDFKRN
jgi:DNA-binding GntR family transcriptional regulator